MMRIYHSENAESVSSHGGVTVVLLVAGKLSDRMSQRYGAVVHEDHVLGIIFL